MKRENEFKKWLKTMGYNDDIGEIKCIGCDRTIKEIFFEDGASAIENGTWLYREDEFDIAYELSLIHI